MGLTRIRAEQISDIDYKQAVRVLTATKTMSDNLPNVELPSGEAIPQNRGDLAHTLRQTKQAVYKK